MKSMNASLSSRKNTETSGKEQAAHACQLGLNTYEDFAQGRWMYRPKLWNPRKMHTQFRWTITARLWCLELREFTAAFTRTKVVVCRPSANCSEQYQLFLRLPEATNVHHYIKHATFITYGTQPSNRTYCMSNAHRLKV